MGWLEVIFSGLRSSSSPSHAECHLGPLSTLSTAGVLFSSWACCLSIFQVPTVVCMHACIYSGVSVSLTLLMGF